MKKEYTAPEIEKVEFNYREQVVASSTTPSTCIDVWIHSGQGSCTDGNSYLESLK